MLSAQEIDRIYTQLQGDIAALNSEIARADDSRRDVIHKKLGQLNKLLQGLIAYKKL